MTAWYLANLALAFFCGAYIINDVVSRISVRLAENEMKEGE
jgi:hypothetical protein